MRRLMSPEREGMTAFETLATVGVVAFVAELVILLAPWPSAPRKRPDTSLASWHEAQSREPRRKGGARRPRRDASGRRVG